MVDLADHQRNGNCAGGRGGGGEGLTSDPVWAAEQIAIRRTRKAIRCAVGKRLCSKSIWQPLEPEGQRRWWGLVMVRPDRLGGVVGAV